MADPWNDATVPGMFLNRVARFGDRSMLASKIGGEWVALSWNEVATRARELSLGLVSLGVAPKDHVCLLSANRREWTIADLAIMSAGAVTVPIYASNVPKDVAYIIDHSESRIVFVENAEQLAKVQATWGDLPRLEEVVLIESEVPDDERVLTFDEVRARGRNQDESVFDKRVSAIDPEDLYTISYTSGTTGPPKGAMLSHRSMRFVNRACLQYVRFETTDRTLCILPLAHMLERFIHYTSIDAGVTIHYAESVEKVAQNLQEVRPHAFFGVPRLFEKVYAAVLNQAENGPPLKRKIFHWARATGVRWANLHVRHEPIPAGLALKRRIADRLVFAKIRARLGGAIKYIGSGGAPISGEIGEFFYACGLPMLEAYGLTETSAPATMNAAPELRFGTVGRPMPGVEVKIAEDGEILLRGGNVYSGYFRRPEATEEATEKDPTGDWFRSGDIGELDADGYLRITDRKKDLLITAGGKNVAPQNIENLIKTDRFISQVVVCGDRKPYLTALVTLDMAEVRKWAAERGRGGRTDAEYAADPEVRALIQTVIDEKNRELARFEQIKKFQILDADFSQETGELTPTMKVKRNVVNRKFADRIETMYS